MKNSMTILRRKLFLLIGSVFVSHVVITSYDFLVQYVPSNILIPLIGILVILVFGLIFEFHDEFAIQLKNAQHTATHDYLTGIPNRLLFNDRLKHALNNARRQNELMAVVFLDLDKFKLINDLYGHTSGDEIVQQVAARLKETTRLADTVARFGGDEFALILENIKDVEDVEMLANKIHSVFDKPYYISEPNVPLPVYGSVGVALLSEDLTSPQEMIDCADQAMYQAKKFKSGICIQTQKVSGVVNVKQR